ncbi:MAG: ribulose-phosphate 3-epimerase [Actinomycetota bacterium]|nr:ribulose-phosphate 3-epimerase [Actinomycetota bacterium]
MAWDDWIRTVEIEPSLYAADFASLGAQVDALLHGEARVFHWDVGDGHFVEPITMGPVVMRWISERVHALGGVLDVHLMVDQPQKHFRQFAEAGADSVTFHFEAVDDAEATARAARELGLQAGLAVNPSTKVEDVAAPAMAAQVDLVLCMSVHPGYSGQEFLPGSLDRLRWLRAALPRTMHLQVDGGITHENVRDAHEAGADLLVAASAIFGYEDLPRSYRRLVQALA